MNGLNQSIAHIPLPRRMNNCKISPKGFPVPWFVSWIDGVPDFRCVDPDKIVLAHKKKLCWLCGRGMGRFKTFVIGPMCAVNRVSAEPPSHRDCAEYAAMACPFLTQPKMRRNAKDLPEDAANPAGIMIARNPGVTLVWVTESYKVFPAGNGALFEIGDPVYCGWYAHGRHASREEVMESIESGMPLLQDMADKEGPLARKALAEKYVKAIRFLPSEHSQVSPF